MLKDLIPRLSGQQVLVVGDVILDEYLIGTATRMSREAPVPVLEFDSRRLIPGGAANPAANIAALGSHAVQVGVTGDDESGVQLKTVIQTHGIDPAGLMTDSSRTTTVKTRIMAQMGLRFPQQVARMDRVSRDAISAEMETQIAAFVAQHAPASDAILFSDYHAGLLTPSLVNSITSTAPKRLLTADAQGELDKYRGFGVVKCNADEARHYLDRSLTSAADFGQAAVELRQRLQLTRCMVITRGSSGITLATATDEIRHVPSPVVSDVFDTVGAGDTTIAVLTLALAARIGCEDAARLANYASGLVVRRVGNYAPTPDELAESIGK